MASSITDEVTGFLQFTTSFQPHDNHGLTQPIPEMSTSNLPEGKDRSARKADNLTAITELIV
jgi:hypothetical protein